MAAFASLLPFVFVWTLCLLPPRALPCGDSLFSPTSSVVRDAFLLTEGESLRLSCAACGVCLPMTDPGCSNRNTQVWMSAIEREKAEIASRTKVRRSRVRVDSFRNFIIRMKEKLVKTQKKIEKAAMTAQLYATVAVQRFDRLRRLGLESESGAGAMKELWNSGIDDSRLQWFVEAAGGDVTRVKHGTGGKKLVYDVLIISRATTGDTGVYTCQWNGQVRARYVVTVVDAGVEPYREFLPSTGRSLQPKLLTKANIEVYTRWMGHTRSLLLPIVGESPIHGVVKANNISITWGICYVRQLDPDRPVKPEGSPSLKLMKHGLPCRSHLLPLSVRSLRSVIMRPSETRKLQAVTLANEDAAHFGLKGANFTTLSPPPLSIDATVIKRSFMMAKQGEFVSLQCPLKQSVRTLIAWFILPERNSTDKTGIDTKVLLDNILNPYDIREQSRGRRFTDPAGNLNIADVIKMVDQRKYFCLHNNRLVGYVHLIIRHAQEESQITHMSSVIMNVLKVASPLVITASIIMLTLITASSMFEPEVQW